MLQIQTAYTLFGRMLIRLWWKLWILAVFLLMLSLLACGLLHGYRGMTTYVCRDPNDPRNTDLAVDLCHHPNITTAIQAEDIEFDKLVRKASVVVDAIVAISEIVDPNGNPGNELLIESDAMSGYFAQFSSELPWHPRGKMVARNLQIHVTKMTGFVCNFRDDFRLRRDSMSGVMRDMFRDAGKVQDHSILTRYMSEVAYLFWPAAFSDSTTVRCLNKFMRWPTHFSAHPETPTIFKDAEIVFESYSEVMGILLPKARDLIEKSLPKWRQDCGSSTSNDVTDSLNYVDKCYKNPAQLLENFESKLERFNHMVERVRWAHDNHVVAVNGLVEIQTDLIHLINHATRPKESLSFGKFKLLFSRYKKWKDPAPISGIVARSILYRFVGWLAEQENRVTKDIMGQIWEARFAKMQEESFRRARGL